MDVINYKKLYALQDKVMDIIFSEEDIFYLTGGTCISRFYKEKRYSDDLDFFTNQNNDFARVMRKIKAKLQQSFSIEEIVSSKDFIRLKINNYLQIDFVNDMVMRYKETVYLENGYKIDNLENIYANKLTAIISRDNVKDIFDLYLIDKLYNYDINEILKVSHKKAVYNNDDLLIRLKTFPLEFIDSIKLIDLSFLDNFHEEFKSLISKIENAM
ncbi:MAG: nucleotidyl transferase AbiEii/AbiGii toxin family protein [Candidatus Marinimicrobia bacterium]|nr:nucleotidyl transferase AbiEii/AbiGii toxin family protein [Candidatus Neomarinimicrobiota bacterium]